MDHVHTLVALLPDSTSEASTGAEDTWTALKQFDTSLSVVSLPSDGISSLSSRGSMHMKLKDVYKSMHKTLGFLNDIKINGFQVFLCDKP